MINLNEFTEEELDIFEKLLTRDLEFIYTHRDRYSDSPVNRMRSKKIQKYELIKVKINNLKGNYK